MTARRARLRAWPSAHALEPRRLLATFLVSNVNDSGPGSLRDAILSANTAPGADVVDFAPPASGTIELTSGQLVITDSVALNGPGADVLAVSGLDASRVVSVVGGAVASAAIDVTLAGLALTHGRAASGAALLNQGFSAVVLRDAVVSGNRAVGTATSSAFGGGIRSTGAATSLTLEQSIVTGNSADGTVNNRAAIGGGVLVERGSLTVVDSEITSNEALGGRQFASGGGLSVQLGRGSLFRSVVSGNRAVAGANRSADGGGASVASAVVTIDASLVAGNEAVGGPRTVAGGNGEGGGVSVLDGSLTVTDSTLSGNRALGGAGGGSADGGGVFVGGSFPGSAVLSLSRSILSANEAVAADGGTGTGVGSGGAIELAVGIASVAECTLSDNRAVAGAGGSRSGDDNSLNTAFGGAISNVFASQLEIAGSTLRHNVALGGSGATQDAPNAADVGGAHGGALFNTFGSGAVVRDTRIEHNLAVGGNGNAGSGPAGFVGVATGGGIDNSFDGLFAGLGPTTLTVVDSTIRHNEAVGGNDNTGSGGQVFVGGGLGGAVANYLGAAADISGTSIDHNRGAGGSGNTAGAASRANVGAGGGVYNAFGRFRLDTGELLADSAVRLSDVSLDHNDAAGGVAGDGLGGGAYNDATSTLVLNAATVTKNTAIGGAGGQGIGGGIYNLGVLVSDPSTVIAKNHASTGNDDLFG
jgi:hypothetical protein